MQGSVDKVPAVQVLMPEFLTLEPSEARDNSPHL